MTDTLLTLAIWWAPVLALAVILSTLKISQLRPGWFAIAVGVYGVYMIAIQAGRDLLPLERFVGPMQWNWEGKIVSIVATLAVFAALRLATKTITAESAGYVFRQRAGSVVPAIMATIIFAASGIAMEILAADGQSLGAERLAFQATMPGLDEELFFRGLLLAALAAAVPSKGVNLLGARITVAGLLVTLLFGLGHGLQVSDGQIQLSWLYIAVTAYLGFGLLWIRERTGSVLWPIIAHNVINVTGSFF